MYSVIRDLTVYFLVILERFSYDFEIHENVPTRQKQETNGIRAIWLVYQIDYDTNVHGFWLVNRTLGCKNFMPQELSRNQRILRYYIILQHDWPMEQCLLHIRVFFGGKLKRPCFDLFIHLPIKQKQEKKLTNAYQNHFSRSFENRCISLFAVCTTKTKVSWFREI